MTYQPVWDPAQPNPAAQNERYAQVRLGKWPSFAGWPTVRGWITSTIGRLARPATSSIQPDWNRQLRNDMLKIEVRRLL